MQRYDARLVADVCGNKDIVMREAHDGLFVRYADVEGLVGALRNLLKEAPDCDCTAMDHSGKGDQHGMFRPCKPLMRYEEAKIAARAALSSAGEGQP